MEYRGVGRSGLMVSPICLGTMMFGKRASERTAGRIVAMARDAGVNFIDTADVYAKGESERIVGKLIRGDRDDWVLATKVANRMGEGPNRRGLGRKWILEAVDHSLRRLGTDYVDIYYLHHDDPETPLEESLGAMADLIARGKVRYWGFSNYRGWRIARMVGICERLNLPRPVIAQPYYNAMDRTPEVEVLPACAAFGIGVAPYSPLARGVLTGKYGTGTTPAKGSRAGGGDERILETEFRPESLEMAQTIKTHAESRGMTAGQFALNWVLNNRLVSAAIVGPRTVAQWKENLGALDHVFTAEDEALIDSLVPPGHPSTPGYSDPAYPIAGRVPRN